MALMSFLSVADTPNATALGGTPPAWESVCIPTEDRGNEGVHKVCSGAWLNKNECTRRCVPPVINRDSVPMGGDDEARLESEVDAF